MEVLKRSIQSLDVTKGNLKLRRDIFTLIEQKIPYKSSFLNTKYPPLHVIIYAIQDILYPKFAWRQTSDFLDLLTVVEIIRQAAVNKARECLVWQEYYKNHESEGAVLLTESEVKSVQNIAAEATDARHRGTYVLVAQGCCWLHIHHLWHTQDQSYLLPRRLTEYFPSLADNGSPETCHSLHRILTGPENDEFHAIGLRCREFIGKAGEWQNKRKIFWKENRLPMELFNADTDYFSFKRDFAAVFPPPLDEGILFDDLKHYLVGVEEMVGLLEGIFGTT